MSLAQLVPLDPNLFDADAELERRIECARIRLASADNAGPRRIAWEELKRLVKQRSPAKILQMEKQRRLR